MATPSQKDKLIVALYAVVNESITFMFLAIQCFLFILELGVHNDSCQVARRRTYRILPNIPCRFKRLRHIVLENDVFCINNLRMSRAAFARLCEMLESTGYLKTTRYVTMQEQVAMFLLILAHHTKNRIVSHNFLRSGHTISIHFNCVLCAVIKLQSILLAKPTVVGQDCTDDRWSSFQGCLGALDGTYVKVNVPLADKPWYRNRKGDVSVNVLAACDRNMNFIYVLTGWEGSATDSRVLRDAVSRPTGLCVPRGMYYLCDSGYANAEGFLTPYKGVRYHLQDWADGRIAPRNREEVFNMRHYRARNVIERAFGLLKGRWAILHSPSFYPIRVHNRIIMACCLLYNYIRSVMPSDPLEVEEEIGQTPIAQPAPEDVVDMVESSQQWNSMRDAIATDIWNAYRGATSAAN